MTLRDAIAALLTEYELEGFVEVVRDDAKADPTWEGLSQDHPRVKRFQEVCLTLRTALAGDPRPAEEG